MTTTQPERYGREGFPTATGLGDQIRISHYITEERTNGLAILTGQF